MTIKMIFKCVSLVKIRMRILNPKGGFYLFDVFNFFISRTNIFKKNANIDFQSVESELIKDSKD